jgi:bis(5'-nucleosidyl)-tetraphosphatase
MKDQAFGIVPIFRQAEQTESDLFLLIQHKAGHWGFPKGHAEAGETIREAACREFEEETGIQNYQLIGTATFVETYCFVKRDQMIEKTVIYFAAFTESTQVRCQEKEIQDYIWLPSQKAIEQITFTHSKQLLQQVEQYLKEHKIG